MAWRWLKRGKQTPPPVGARILFYTRSGCHLCDEAWEVVAAAQERHGLTVEKVDVDADPALAAQHGDCVPVVVIDGAVRFRGRVNAVLLERMLR